VTDGREIEVVVARAHLEANARGSVALDEQLAVTEDPMDEIARSSVEDDDVDGQAELSLHVGRDVEVELVEGLRCFLEQTWTHAARVIDGNGGVAPVA